MELSFRVLVAIVIALVIFAVIIALVTDFGRQANGSVSGLFKFFDTLLSGKQVGALPNVNLPAK